MLLHLDLSFSENEITARNKLYTQQDPGSLVNLKESIRSVFISWVQVGLDKKSRSLNSIFRPLGLARESPNGGIKVYAWIFVNDIRLDLASHTIVADACVIPLSQENIDKLSPALERLTGIDRCLIVTPDDETKLWKLLLPALAERCRTWKHLPTCEYLFQGIPAYMKPKASPLCSCGKGKDLGIFGTRSEWKEFHSEATRIALSPLFSSSFLKIIHEGADVENALSLKSPVSEVSQSLMQCANCNGPGQPSLLFCSVCKQTKYCSRTCQKNHWKTHKLHCSKAS